MGRKIFISYKYSDASVQQARDGSYTTVRDYVDAIQSILDKEDHINKGEDDGEDLSNFKDEYIESHLRKKIFDSTVTIVIISPRMKDSTPESDQWIPWEISYSLRQKSIGNQPSYPNAVLAVVLPDRNGSYEYYIKNNRCCGEQCRTLNTDILFKILRENMFNKVNSNKQNCMYGKTIHYGESSYILSVKWSDFTDNVNKYINNALTIKQNMNDYRVVKKF